jgi:uncharacterized protein
MGLIHLIRRRGIDIALVALSMAALAAGGDAVLSGAEIFAGSLLPPSAQAEPTPHDFARLTFDQPFGASRYGPQVLYPVRAAIVPDWLNAAPQAPLVRLTPPSITRHPVIAICIDDLGEDIAGTDRAIALRKEVALSFLPFAEATPFLAAEAARKGHTVLAHVPMQAVGAANPGPMALAVGMAAEEIARRVAYALNRVPSLSGINNHEGSRFTADAAALAPVMAALKARHLFFFDSRTGAGSKVMDAAAAAGVESAARDVFLDDDPKPEAVAAALDELARTAKAHGVAIAIGHPHDATLKALAAWLSQDHGVTLVPLQGAIRLKNLHPVAVASR